MIYVSVARYALGVVGLLLVCVSVGVAGLTLRQRWLPQLTGAVARLAEVIIGLAILTLLLELLGSVGGFKFAPIILACAALALLCATAARRTLPGLPHAPYGLEGATVGVAAIVSAAVIVEWAVPTLQSYDVGIRSFDSLWYHLPWAASFAQTGHIAQLRFTDVEYLTAFYPATAELFHGLGIVLLGRDTLSPALNLLWLGLVLLAAYCVGRPWRLGALTATGAALAMATPMMRFSQPGSAANDVVGIFFLLAAMALLVNAPESRAAAATAAAAAGLAIAVKLSMVVPALAMTVGAITIAPPGRRRQTSAVWIVPLLLTGGFWYLRNLIAVGNPLPWTGALGLPTPAAPLQAHTGFTVLHYLGDGHAISHFLEPGLAAGLGPWWQAILVLALIGPALCVVRGPGAIVRMLGAVALLAVVGYVLTPESAAGPAGQPLGFAFNLRYAAPALTLCLVVAPLAAPLVGRRRTWAVLGAGVLLLISILAEARLWPGSRVPVAIVVGACALLLVGSTRAPRAAGVSALIGATLLAVFGGYFLQRHYLRGRYVYQPGVSSLARVWALFRNIHHARVGIVGTFGGFFSYPLFGADDSNAVVYIALKGPHGSFTPIGSCREWRNALNAGHYRYVVTTPARDPWRPQTLSFSPEGGWTAARGARQIYSYRALGQPIRVYELRARLDPAGCATR